MYREALFPYIDPSLDEIITNVRSS